MNGLALGPTIQALRSAGRRISGALVIYRGALESTS